MQVLKEEIKAVINEVCDRKKLDLSDESSPLLEAGMDSLDYATVLMVLEDKFHFELQDDEMEFIRSIDDIANFLNTKKNGGVQESARS